MFLKAATTDAVLAQFRETLDKLRGVEQHHTEMVEKEDVVIDEAMRRRRAAADEATKASIVARRLSALLDPELEETNKAA